MLSSNTLLLPEGGGNVLESCLPAAIKQQVGAGKRCITLRDAPVQTGETCKAKDYYNNQEVVCGTPF